MNKKETMALVSSAVNDTIEANVVAMVIYVIFLLVGIGADIQSIEKAKDIFFYSIIVFGISVYCRISIPPIKHEHGSKRIIHVIGVAIMLPTMLVSFTFCVVHYLFL